MTVNEAGNIIAKIERLRIERDAIILAHNYQNDEIQDLAQIVGDSLALSQMAAKTDAKVIVFCGVHFMAESAAILSPRKTVLLPAVNAGCPLADMGDPQELLNWRQKYPKAAVVSYVNSSAAVKAQSKYCCTSANAVKLVRNIPEKEIIFIPDQNLGRYVAAQVPEKAIHVWPGYCLTHYRVTADDVKKVRELYPEALLLVHPECRPEVVGLADFVGSTAEIITYAKKATARELVIGTEMGVIHALKKENPGKKFFLLSQGLVCPNMKRTTSDKVLKALETMSPVITVAPELLVEAQAALDRMLEYV